MYELNSVRIFPSIQYFDWHIHALILIFQIYHNIRYIVISGHFIDDMLLPLRGSIQLLFLAILFYVTLPKGSTALTCFTCLACCFFWFVRAVAACCVAAVYRGLHALAIMLCTRPRADSILTHACILYTTL